MMDDLISKISRLITADPDVFYEDKLRIDLSSHISDILRRGYVHVWREEGATTDWWGGKSQGLRGVYYWPGDENETKLPLGNCLVAYNKVHAVHLLGFSDEFILDKLNYNVDTPREERSTEGKRELINRYVSGNPRHGLLDQFDIAMAEGARHAGYDTIILLKEPDGSARNTEIVDIRNVKPESVDSIERSYKD